MEKPSKRNLLLKLAFIKEVEKSMIYITPFYYEIYDRLDVMANDNYFLSGDDQELLLNLEEYVWLKEDDILETQALCRDYSNQIMDTFDDVDIDKLLEKVQNIFIDITPLYELENNRRFMIQFSKLLDECEEYTKRLNEDLEFIVEQYEEITKFGTLTEW